MTKTLMLAAALAVGLPLGLASSASAQNALELGVQGRPHGGNTAERMFAFRHGIPYHRHHHHFYRSYYRHYGY